MAYLNAYLSTYLDALAGSHLTMRGRSLTTGLGGQSFLGRVILSFDLFSGRDLCFGRGAKISLTLPTQLEMTSTSPPGELRRQNLEIKYSSHKDDNLSC